MANATDAHVGDLVEILFSCMQKGFLQRESIPCTENLFGLMGAEKVT